MLFRSGRRDDIRRVIAERIPVTLYAYIDKSGNVTGRKEALSPDEQVERGLRPVGFLAVERLKADITVLQEPKKPGRSEDQAKGDFLDDILTVEERPVPY